MPSPLGFPDRPLNMFAVFKGLTDQNIGFFTGNVNPVNGTSGFFVGSAAKGSIYINATTGEWYIQLGNFQSVTWTKITAALVQSAGLGISGNAKFTYDFAVDGGSIGTITPSDSPTLPAGAVILGGFVNVDTPVTSGGPAMISLGLGSGAQNNDLKAAGALAQYTAGIKAIIPVNTAATMVKVLADAPLTLTVSGAPLTGGKFSLNLVYLLG